MPKACPALDAGAEGGFPGAAVPAPERGPAPPRYCELKRNTKNKSPPRRRGPDRVKRPARPSFHPRVIPATPPSFPRRRESIQEDETLGTKRLCRIISRLGGNNRGQVEPLRERVTGLTYNAIPTFLALRILRNSSTICRPPRSLNRTANWLQSAYLFDTQESRAIPMPTLAQPTDRRLPFAPQSNESEQNRTLPNAAGRLIPRGQD